MSIPAKLSLLPPMVRVLLVGAVLSRLAFSMTTPFLTIYLLRHTHLSVAAVGFVVGGAAVAGMAGGFIAGALTDLLGRKPILLSTLYIWVMVFILFAIAHAPAVLIVLTLLNGACRSIFDPVSQVLMSDLTPVEERYHVFSLRYTAANIGYSVGPLLGAWLGLTGGDGAFLFSGAVFLVYTVLLQVMMAKVHSSGESHSNSRSQTSFHHVVKVILADRVLWFYLLGGMLVRSAYEQINTNVSVHLQQHVMHGLVLYSVLISLNAIVVVVGQMPISRWAEKKSLLLNVFLGNLCYALGLMGLAFTRNWAVGMVAMVVFTVGEILSFPAGTLFIDKIAPEEMRGAYYGTKNVLDLGKFFGPWLGGLAMAAWGGTVMLNLCAVVVLLSTLLYRVGLTQLRPSQRMAPQPSTAKESG
ncbi:MFS transporter [Alicyclobacillus contaminans]|uniref:MDR family MFS transporter n=1 Tax=Alicyclobacillus contaminans TaxID=392016 RepID=UPI0004028443|nr:MFS transporter [Alicyclobacillus contaminans]GMA51767.1 MFS transporter [Alicyclobacillus contaminans]